MTMGKRKPAVIIFQLFLILLCLGAAVGVLMYFKAFEKKPGYRHVTLRIESTGGIAIVTYAVPGDEIPADDPINVNTPWEKTYTLASGSEVYLTAGNPAQTGTITCYIKLEGQPWKSMSSRNPDDKVACAGIVP